MKRLPFVSLRIFIALAIVLAGAGFLMPLNAAEAASPSPETLTTGSLAENWRYVEAIGTTGVPYNVVGGQGSHLNQPGGIFVEGSSLYVLERSGKRLRSFTGLDFSGEIAIPGTSGVNNPFWGPNDVTRFDGHTWVADNHHLVVLEADGTPVADFDQFNNSVPNLGWVNNRFECANSVSVGALSGLVYVAQNCGNNNPVLVLAPNLIASQPTLTLVDAWSMGGDWKHHIQAADMNSDWEEEVYISGDFGVSRCLENSSTPGDWTCNPFGGTAFSRARGMFFSGASDPTGLYVLDSPDDWGRRGLRRCEYSGACTDVVTNNNLDPQLGLVFDDPQDVAYDHTSGDYYITDGYRQVIGRLSPLIPSFTIAYGVDMVPYVTDPGYLNNPTSVIVDAQNNLYVAEQQGRRIVSYNPAGALRWEFGVPGVWMNNEATEICQPQGTMAFDPTGNLYVADRCNGRVVILNPANGVYLSSFRFNTGGANVQGFNGPAGVAFSPGGRLFVSDPDNHRVQEYRYIPYAGWSYVSTIGTPFDWGAQTLAPDQFADPVGLAASSDIEIFIADQNYNRIQKCTRADAGATNWTCQHFIGTAWVNGGNNYLLNNPQGIALDGQGNLLVADNNNNRVKVFDAADGSYLTSIGTGDWGEREYEFQNPQGVAVDTAGNVYVADSNNFRVQKFAPVAPAMEFLTQMGGNSYVSELVGGYLYTSNGNRIDVYDVTTDPTTPLWVGRTQAIPGEIMDMAVAGNYAYVVTNYGHLVVFDINLPANPAYVREVMMMGEGQAAVIDGASLYVLQNGPSMVARYDLTDPAAPAYDSVHWLDYWSYDLVIHNGMGYVGGDNGNGEMGHGVVVSFSTTDMGGPNALVQDLGSREYRSCAPGLALDGAMLYAADPCSGLYRIDTTGVAFTEMVGLPRADPNQQSPQMVDILGGRAYLKTWDYLAVVDISGSPMTLEGDYSIPDWRQNEGGLAATQGTGSALLYIPASEGLMTYSVDETSAAFAILSEEADDFSAGWQTQVVGDTLYTIDLGILRIFNVADPIAPVLINSLEHVRFPASAYSPFVVRQVGAQRILYILGWQNGDSVPPVIPTLETFDVTDSMNILPLDSIEFNQGENLMAVAEVNGSVVVAVTERGWWDQSLEPDVWNPGRLILFDATNPADLSQLAEFAAFDGSVRDIEISGNYVFVAEENRYEEAPDNSPDNNNHGGGGGLRVFEGNADFSTLAQVAHFGGPDTQKLDVEGNQVFVTDRWNGLYALTIASAPLPQDWTFERISWFNNDTHDVQVKTVDGKRIAWVGNSSRMFILDVTNFNQVQQLAVQDLPFHSELDVSQNLPFVWTSGFGQGMSGWWAAPTMDGTVTNGGTLTSSPDEVTYTFDDETLRLWHTPVFQGNLPPAPAGKLGFGRAFESRAFDSVTEQPVAPVGTYTLTVGYDSADLGVLAEGALKLYYWSGTAWVLEPSTIERATDTLTAHPNHFSQYWSVFGGQDTDLPTGTITINDGAEYTISSNVTLTLSANDPTTSVVMMRFSEDNSTWTAAEPYATSKSFTLTGMDGPKTVYVRFIDEAGNVSLSVSDSITLDTQAPTDNSVTINEGEVVNNPAVTLTPASTGAAWMRFSEDSTFTGVVWVAYSTAAQNFTLSAGDGSKTVYAQYRDAAGYETAVVNDTVELDTQAPTGNGVTINGGEFVNSTAVTLTPASTGAAQMRFSEDSSFTGVDWTAYSSDPLGFTLSTGDGLKTVYAQYRDEAGNVSVVVFDTVTLDTVVPNGVISINSGAAMTANPAVTLQIATVEDVTGMRFMESNGPWSGEWSTLSATANVTLTGADGEKTVYVQFRDRAGNVSTAVISDTILLDTIAPVGTGSVLINSGAAFATQAAVWLTLTPTDATSGVSEMMISNASDGTGGTWVPFSGSAAWTLSAGDGEKTVYVWYRDALGNQSGPFNDTIVLDATAPAGSVTIAGGVATTTTSTAALTLTYTGTETGLEMRLSNSVTALSGAAWQPFAGTVAGWNLGVGNGVKEVFVQFRDSAGNLSPVYSDTILFDDIDPTGSLYINGMAALTNDADADLFIVFNEEGSGVVQMRVAASEAGLTSATYVAYANPATFTLTGGDGAKTVCVQLKDAAGNESLAICDTITLDTTAPVGSLSINGGAAETLQQNVTLTLTATDATSGMGFMMISNDSGFSGAEWQPYAASLAWTLTNGAGDKTVYVKYMDLAGNETAAIADTIKFTEGYSVYLPLLRR